MDKFGKNKPRLLESFGVAGLLREEAEIFYSALFSTRSLGRVSDLIVAKLKKVGVDEFRLRVFLIFGVFQGYRSQYKEKSFRFFPKDDDLLEEPLLLECGIDQEKVVVGISFNLSSKVNLNSKGLSERIFKEESNDTFEEMLIAFQKYADRLIVKYEPGMRKVEIDLFLGILGKIDSEVLKIKPPLELVILDRPNLQNTPRPKAYIQLGDLDYPKLLQDGVTKKHLSKIPVFPTGELLAPGQPEKPEEVPEEAIGVSQEMEDSTLESIVVKGKSDAIQEEIIVKGTTDHMNLESIVVKGTADATLGEIIVKGTKDSSPESIIIHGQKIQDQDDESKVTIKGVTEQFNDEFIRIAGEKQPQVGSSTIIVSGASNSDKTDGELDVDVSITGAELSDPETESKNLIKEMSEGALGQRVMQVRQELMTAHESVRDNPSVLHVKTLMEEFISERFRITEAAKKVVMSVRANEKELKNKITALERDIEFKKAKISETNIALIQVKDQLAKFSSDIIYQEKYNQVHKMLVTSKEEGILLSRRVNDLKSQVNDLKTQLNLAKSESMQSSSLHELTHLQTKYDRICAQFEDVKRTNQQLLRQEQNSSRRNKMDDSKTNDQLKFQLDEALKSSVKNRKEVDVMRERVLALKKNEIQMKLEVDRLKTEIKQLKKLPLGGASEGTSGAA